MSNLGSLKAYRPSAYMVEDEVDEQLLAAIKARNVARYARMVSQGMRLFEPGEINPDFMDEETPSFLFTGDVGDRRLAGMPS